MSQVSDSQTRFDNYKWAREQEAIREAAKARRIAENCARVREYDELQVQTDQAMFEAVIAEVELQNRCGNDTIYAASVHDRIPNFSQNLSIQRVIRRCLVEKKVRLERVSQGQYAFTFEIRSDKIEKKSSTIDKNPKRRTLACAIL